MPRTRRSVLGTIGGIGFIGTVGGTVSATDEVVVSDSSESIQAAVDEVDEGGTVVVEDDTYREQVIVRKDLTVRGEGDPTLVPPEGSLGVSDIPIIQPIFGAVGSENEVTFEGFTVDGEFADKGGFYSCISYFKADGQARDLTLTGADYGGYISQNRGGGGDQTVDVINSEFRDIGFDDVGPDIQLLYNEPGTTGTVRGNSFVGTDDDPAFFKYGLSSGFGASLDIKDNVFEDFDENFSLGYYAFNSPDNTVRGNTFRNTLFPVYVASTPRVRTNEADEQRIVQNTFDGSALPDDTFYDSYGVTLFAFDEEDDGQIESVNNAKVVNNDFSSLDFGVASFTSGDGVIRNTKIIRNEFDDVETTVTDSGVETKQQANRVE